MMCVVFVCMSAACMTLITVVVLINYIIQY